MWTKVRCGTSRRARTHTHTLANVSRYPPLNRTSRQNCFGETLIGIILYSCSIRAFFMPHSFILPFLFHFFFFASTRATFFWFEHFYSVLIEFIIRCLSAELPRLCLGAVTESDSVRSSKWEKIVMPRWMATRKNEAEKERSIATAKNLYYYYIIFSEN